VSQFNRILVATDFSSHGDKAVASAVSVAKTFGASIDLLHAIAIPWPVITPYEVSLPGVYVEETRRAARDSLERCAEKIQGEGIEVRTHLEDAPPAEAIVSCAKRLGSDLIVIGTHGHSGLKHVLLGSVAERTLRLAPCPVLSVKADPADE
jgi:universal stress protein A